MYYPFCYSPCLGYSYYPFLGMITPYDGAHKFETLSIQSLAIENQRQFRQSRDQCFQIDEASKRNGRAEQLGINRVLNSKKSWTQEQDEKLCDLVEKQKMDWTKISVCMQGRTESMCYNRYRKISLNKINRHWKKEQDNFIMQMVVKNGFKWKGMSKYLANRTPKQIRERYLNALRPNINKGQWDKQEDQKLIGLVKEYGHKWKSFQYELPGRTQSQIKSRYYGRLNKLV